MRRIPIVIPSYEPNENLLKVIDGLFQNGINDILIVDDGSSEEYQQFFVRAREKYGVKVIHHYVNRGKGRALKSAFKYLLKTDPGILGCVTADSDGQHTTKDILRCIEAFKEHPNNLVCGCRNLHGDEVPWKSKLGNGVTYFLMNYVVGVKASDTQSGLRGIPAGFMKKLINAYGERFEYEAYMMLMTKNQYPVFEVPIETVYDSKENHKTHFRAVKDTLQIYGAFGKWYINQIKRH